MLLFTNFALCTWPGLSLHLPTHPYILILHYRVFGSLTIPHPPTPTVHSTQFPFLHQVLKAHTTESALEYSPLTKLLRDIYIPIIQTITVELVEPGWLDVHLTISLILLNMKTVVLSGQKPDGPHGLLLLLSGKNRLFRLVAQLHHDSACGSSGPLT